MARPDPYNARTTLEVGGESYGIYALDPTYTNLQ